jgi:hypothetical protein
MGSSRDCLLPMVSGDCGPWFRTERARTRRARWPGNAALQAVSTPGGDQDEGKKNNFAGVKQSIPHHAFTGKLGRTGLLNGNLFALGPQEVRSCRKPGLRRSFASLAHSREICCARGLHCVSAHCAGTPILTGANTPRPGQSCSRAMGQSPWRGKTRHHAAIDKNLAVRHIPGSHMDALAISVGCHRPRSERWGATRKQSVSRQLRRTPA